MLSKEKIKLLKILLKELSSTVTEEEHFKLIEDSESAHIKDPFLKELFSIYHACNEKIPIGIIYSCLKRKTIIWLWD